MKKCFKCGVEKPLSEFYKHPRMADGTVNKCKECNKKDVRENRELRHDYYIEYDRQRGGSRQDPQYLKDYRAKCPKKYKAHLAVANAIRKGILVNPRVCELCPGSYSVVAHHCDYDKPLDVIWLCEFCHKQWHKENGEGLNAD